MTPEVDTRDRVIRLEAEVEGLKKTVDGMSAKVSEMHAILQQAKGARYIVVVAAGLGGFISAKLGHLFPWGS